MTAATQQRSIWHHDGHTATHEGYRLSCDEYEVLTKRAEGRCSRCGIQDPNLVIDHDHAHEYGMRAVRGMVCSRCNQLIAVVDRGARLADDLTATYLADPFHQLLSRKRTPRGLFDALFAAMARDPDGTLSLLAPYWPDAVV